MKRILAVLALIAALGLGGCGMNKPTYETVRGEVTSTLDEVVAVIPDPKEIQPQSKGEPYPCDDPMLLADREGAFFTGHWFVYVPESFDIDAFIASLPGLLGDDWEVRDPQIEVSFANVDLLYKPLSLTVSVEEALTGDRPAIELLAISRCGILPDDAKPRESRGGRGS